MSFTHLHVHTEYSLLDGMCRIPALIKKAQSMGMDSLAITDHGSLYGIIQFYAKAKAAGIKPILGCELYVAPFGRFSKTSSDKKPYHLVVLAKNEVGYHNLLQLSTKGFLEGFYHKPRVDRELLEKHSDGLVALSACVQGEVARLIIDGQQDEAEEAALWYKNTFENFYFEIQEHDIAEQTVINQALAEMSRKLDIPLVATNDVHYIEKEDAPIHDILLCIQTGKTVNDDKRIKMADDSFYLRSPEEMAAFFSQYPGAMENTEQIAQMCDLNLEFDRLRLPRIDLPEGKTPDEYLADLCWQGFETRYPDASDDVKERLVYELDVIRQTEFPNYFLIVWELISWVREQKILFGVRGSAAASIVLYCLGITDIDPLAHNLVFERFLNVERKEMPDIDLDFQDDRREEAIQYMLQRYGADRVAQIITFGTLGAKASLKDVGRALDMKYSNIDPVARLLPSVGGNLFEAMGLDEEKKNVIPELVETYTSDSAMKRLIDIAIRLEGIARHASTHAAGIVVSRDPLVEHVALQRPTGSDQNGLPTTQLSMEEVGKVGLLKLDFLGLANLSVLGKSIELISRTRGFQIDLQKIPLDDPETYKLLASGETAGVFQLESAGMRRCIKDLKPTCFSDIASLVALYRPGPMDHINTFIGSKHNEIPVTFPHAALEEILEETYGIIVYQDQVLKIVQTFAGYSLGQADIVRKAMGKKKAEIMEKEREGFIAGATQKRGFSSETAEQVFSLIEPFAGYAFNKAHATSYAMIAYQTAYLKTHYPAEFMTAWLTTYMGNQEKVAGAIGECRRLGIGVAPPDINHSQKGFTIEQDANSAFSIRFGLAVIKNVGEGAIAPIIAEREKNGPFKSIEDFCRRADLRKFNKRALECLIKVGALDCLGNRGALLGGLDRILKMSQQEQQLKETGQSTMFDLWGETTAAPLPVLNLAEVELRESDMLEWEKELLGVYVTAHPLVAATKDLGNQVTALCNQINSEMNGQEVTIVGTVMSLRRSNTKKGNPFVSATIEDLSGTIDLTVWSEVLETTEDLWAEGNTILLLGKVTMRGNRVQLTCKNATRYETGMAIPWNIAEAPPSSPPKPHQLTITFWESSNHEDDLTRLRQLFEILGQYPGIDHVFLLISSDSGTVTLDLPNHPVNYCPELQHQIIEIAGKDSLVVAS